MSEMLLDREKTYVERWQSQRKYYSDRSTRNKLIHQSLQFFIGVAAVLLSYLINTDTPDWITSILSLLVAIAAVYQNVYKPGELWITYRQTLEALKRERALYDVRAGSYRKTDYPLELFAERCEGIIAQETSRFGAKDEEQEGKK